MRRKRKRKKLRPAELTEDQILAWADAYHKLTGRWPTRKCRPRVIQSAPAERWSTIDEALRRGFRGLAGGSSLARLLAARRGVRNPAALPRLTVGLILKWADEQHDRIGRWPSAYGGSGRREVPGAPAERWSAINTALENGLRGLSGGSSLAGLLSERRGVRNPAALPRLTIRQILKWCDEFHARSGRWPNRGSAFRKTISGSGGETWSAVDYALQLGTRGLPGGSSLAKLLAEHRGVRNIHDLPSLTVRQVLAWADAWHERTGHWPRLKESREEIRGSGGETWGKVFNAVTHGWRGLPSGFTFSDLLAEHRGVRNTQNLPELTPEQILAWADAFHRQTGQWPTRKAQPQEIPDTLGETWFNVSQALAMGLRGLPGGSSLARLLAQQRGVRNPKALPPLTVRQILAWADAFRARTGQWPTRDGSPQDIEGTAVERWHNVDAALRNGLRGLPGRSSLAQLLARHRGVPNTAVPMKYRMAHARR